MMENKSRLRPELQAIVEQFVKFRNEYSSLKAHFAAQDELINLQKLELEQLHRNVEQLASTLVDYQRRFNATLHNLEVENDRLQKTIENLNREYENSRINNNDYIQEVYRNNDEYSRQLEEQLAELQTKITTQDEKHEKQIKSIEKHYRDEISQYKTKVEQMNLLEKRHSEELSAYKKKLEQIYSTQIRQVGEISESKEKIADAKNTMDCSAIDKRNASHPALNDKIGNKRKKFTPASHRWPQLSVAVKKEILEKQTAVQRGKRRLYQVDNEMTIDLES